MIIYTIRDIIGLIALGLLVVAVLAIFVIDWFQRHTKSS